MRTVILSILAFIGVLVVVDMAFNRGRITMEVVQLVRHEVHVLRR